ncbi:hypothetical protein CRUP_036437 [Coryphaenoides rupestris]|nr:hypothetical protein CRUP_036437 [Coryphaenoides rupestris]
MVSIRRLVGLKSPAEMTYYAQHDGVPLAGASAAKVLNTVDSQTMALTLGYFVQLQAEPVVKNPPNNLWILAAVLAPIAVVTLIIIIITAVLCRKNKNDFKADSIGNLNPRAKMAYRRDVGYFHQPVQGFDYAKQHLGRQGADEEVQPVTQDTLMMALPLRDAPLSLVLEKPLRQDSTASKKNHHAGTDTGKRMPTEDGSVIGSESEKRNSSRGLTVQNVPAQQKVTKEERRRRDGNGGEKTDGLTAGRHELPEHPRSRGRRCDLLAAVSLALKQKSDIEHYRNKLRLKAKRKGYYDFASADAGSSSSSRKALDQGPRGGAGHERTPGEPGRPPEPDDERGSTFVKSHRRHSQAGQPAYRSRQSINSPSPGGTEIDLLVMRERPRRGIRNSGYDSLPVLALLRQPLWGAKKKRPTCSGHSETSTLSSQPSIDEVRQQMHLLLEEAFSLASGGGGGHSTYGRHSHSHHHHPNPGHYGPAPPPLPFSDVITSAPGTVGYGRGGLQWAPSYGADSYQCSIPKPGRSSEASAADMQTQLDTINPYHPPATSITTTTTTTHTTNTPALLPPSNPAQRPNYSGNPITAVYAIPASRPGYSEYLASTPPTSYHSPSWMSYPPEPEDVAPQWAESVPLPGYVEAFPLPRYPQSSPPLLPLPYIQTTTELLPAAPTPGVKQSSPLAVKNMDSLPLTSLSTSALVQAIRLEVAKLAKKQSDMFEFQV